MMQQVRISMVLTNMCFVMCTQVRVVSNPILFASGDKSASRVDVNCRKVTVTRHDRRKFALALAHAEAYVCFMN